MINSHQTCQKPVKNLYKTYAGWPRLDAQECSLGLLLDFGFWLENFDCVLGFHWSALEFSQTFASVFTRLWRHGYATCFISFIKLLVSVRNKEKDDIRSTYVYFNFFHETVHSHNCGNSQPYCSRLRVSKRNENTLLDQSKRTYYPNYFISLWSTGIIFFSNGILELLSGMKQVSALVRADDINKLLIQPETHSECLMAPVKFIWKQNAGGHHIHLNIIFNNGKHSGMKSSITFAFSHTIYIIYIQTTSISLCVSYNIWDHTFSLHCRPATKTQP